MKKLIIDAAGLVLVGALLGIVTNFCRSDGIPLVASIPYEILVPCPMDRVAVNEIVPDKIPKDAVFIDASDPEIFKQRHVPGALPMPYDDLADPTEAELASIRALKTSAVVVYGPIEGDFNVGRQQATDLAAQGLPRIYYVKDGLKALTDFGCEGTDCKGEVP